MKPIPTTLTTVQILFFSIFQTAIGYPEENSISEKIVENFLTNPNLSDLRLEVGVTNSSTTQIQVVGNQDTCNTLDDEFDSCKDKYIVSYYQVGDFYFVTQILKQPNQVDEVITGLSFIYVYDENLNFIKGYSG